MIFICNNFRIRIATCKQSTMHISFCGYAVFTGLSSDFEHQEPIRDFTHRSHTLHLCNAILLLIPNSHYHFNFCRIIFSSVFLFVLPPIRVNYLTSYVINVYTYSRKKTYKIFCQIKWMLLLLIFPPTTKLLEKTFFSHSAVSHLDKWWSLPAGESIMEWKIMQK